MSSRVAIKTLEITAVATVATIVVSVLTRLMLHEPLTWMNALVIVLGAIAIASPIAYYVARQADQLAKAYEMLAAANVELLHTSRHDALTGLLNRRAFMEILQQVCEAGESYSLILLDVDHFKRINDEYGHPVGDEALKLVGKTLAASTSESSFASRIGGEEFAVIMKDIPRQALAAEAERLRTAIASIPLITSSGNAIRMTVSVGALDGTARSSSEAFAFVDKALYEAKAAGRNQVRLFA